MALAAAVSVRESSPVANRRPCAIGIEDVSKTYLNEKGEPRTVLSAINLQIEAGEFVVVLGETGCGKSTLLRLILGEEAPTTGSIQVSGKTVKRIDASCGYVPQRYSLFPNRTALKNVTYGPRTAKYPLLPWLKPSYFSYRKRLKAEATEQLLRMGLRAGDANKYPHKMSGGMQQRVAIAQALIMRPAVMLMDEAFNALDPSTRISLQELVLDIWREQHPTVVFVTHNVAEALFLGTRLIVLGAYADKMEGKTNVIADMRLQQSELPFLERRHTQEFIELQSYVEELSYGISCPR